MSSSASPEFRSALQVDKKRIANLTDNELEELMQQLLTAQSHLCGAPLSRALVNTEGKAKDGGADGSSGRPKRPDDWLGDRETCWQFKAGVAGNPSRLLEEVGKPRPSEALRKGKRFVVVASGSNNGDEGVRNRLEKLRQAAEEAKLPTEQIAVIGSEGLAAWCNQHPAIAARLENRPDGLSSHEEWASQAEVNNDPWQAIDSLTSALVEYRQKLDPASQSDAPCLHLHLHGPRGIGKTRLALELCSHSPWVEWLVYVRQASTTTVDLLRQVARDEGVRAVVVADETPQDLLLPLREALNLSKGRARLITLGSSHSPDPRRIPELKLPGLPAEGLRSLIAGWYPAMADAQVQIAVDLAADNPRLARLAADALVQNPDHSESTLRELPAIRALLEAIADHNKPLGRSDWSWPKTIDDSHYRFEKRQGFVGRDKLRKGLQAWARQEHGKKGLVIVADYGVGKTAFLAEVIDTAAAGRPVVAHHFCRADIRETLQPGAFVRSLASQLAQALPAYRALIEADDAKELRDKLDQATEQSGDSAEKAYDKAVYAFDQAVLAPLRRIVTPAEPLLLVVDALDEVQDPRALSGANGTPPTIVSLLARHATYLPPWLKVVATCRRREDVLGPLEQAFLLKKIDAEEEDNLTDLLTYTEQRCQGSPLKERLAAAQLTASEVAQFLCSKQQSSGKFLYIVLVLSALESEKLPLAGRADLKALPSGLDAFYREIFERRFPSRELYTPIKLLLGLLCVQQEPLGYAELGAILNASIDQIGLWLAPLEDLLRIQSFPSEGLPSSPYAHWRVSFDHVSLQQWLTAFSPGRRFSVDAAAAAELIRAWALAEVAADRAHTWPYLVRNLTELFTSQSGVDCLSSLLCNYKWIKQRLKLSGVNAILSDIDAIPRERLCSAKAKALDLLRQVIGQSSHILGNEKAWNGSDQLETQLLIRLAVSDNKFINECLSEAKKEIVLMQIPYPLQPSLFSLDQRHAMMDKANPACLPVVLLEDILAYSNQNHDIILWSLTKRECVKKLEGHKSDIRAIQVMGEDQLLSGSMYGTIKVWNLRNDECHTVDHHTEAIKGFIKLSASDFLSYSTTEIRRWGLPEGHPIVLESAKIEKEINLLHKVDNDEFICLSTDQKLFYFSFSRKGYISLPIFVDKILHCQPLLEGRWLIGTSRQFYIWDPYPLNQANKHATECDRVRIDKRPFDLVLLKALSGGALFALSHSRHLFAWRNGDLQADPQEFELISNLEQFVDIDISRIAQVSSNGDISIKTLDNTATPIRTSTSRSVVSAIEFLDDCRIVVIHGDGLVRICHVDESGISDICCQSGSQISSQSDLAVLDNSTFITSSESGDLLVWSLDKTANILTTIQVIDFRSVCKFNNSGAVPLFISSLSKNKFIAADLHNIIVYDINQKQLPQLDNPKRIFGNKHKKLASTLTHNGIMFAMWEPKSSLNELTIVSRTNSLGEGVYPDFTPVRACAALANDMIASATSSHEIVIWERGISKPIRILRGHTSWIRDLVRIEGNIILSCSDDQTMRIWDTSDETARGTIVLVSDSRITSLAYKSSQRKIIAGDQEGKIHLFSR